MGSGSSSSSLGASVAHLVFPAPVTTYTKDDLKSPPFALVEGVPCLHFSSRANNGPSLLSFKALRARIWVVSQ